MRSSRFLAAASMVWGTLVLWSCLHQAKPVHAETTWNVYAAAQRMDQRQNWWMNWPKAQRDHGTVCVSCHTVLPYAMARASLRGPLGETEPSPPEQTMLRFVTTRVNGWSEMEPFYNDAKSGPRKSVESRGTESVLNALVLARYDSVGGIMQPTTSIAFQNMWALQLKEGDSAGAWDWLNFHLAPWESDTSPYYGAALAAVAISIAPGNYAHNPDIQPNLQALAGYLQRNYDAQPLVNRVVLLWASTDMPNLLSKKQKEALTAEIFHKQAPDGGWSLVSLGSWHRKDNTELDTSSDGYATGLTVYALLETGYAIRKPEMQRARQWLVAHQSPDGFWTATSLNKDRDPKSDPAFFMSDAATGFSVMALESMGR